MLLFRSEEHVRAWYPDGAPGQSLSVEQGWQLGRVWYGDRASPDWRRRTADEAQAVLAGLGLTGEFWLLAP